MAVAHAGYPVYPWLAGPSCSSQLITGIYDLAINVPFRMLLIVHGLRENLYGILMASRSFRVKILLKIVDRPPRRLTPPTPLSPLTPLFPPHRWHVGQ